MVALKHMNPCGIGTGDTIEAAPTLPMRRIPFDFGRYLSGHRTTIDLATAEKCINYSEIIIAPDFTEEAFAVLSKKKTYAYDLRL